MNSQRTTRPATPEDEDFLWRLYVSTRAGEIAAFGWPPQQADAFLRMQYRARTGSYSAAYPHAQYNILLQGDSRAGAMIVNRSAQEIRLVDIALLPEHRNRGYGTCEVTNLIRQSIVLGVPLRLSVRQGNPAIRLYQRHGFISLSEDAVYIEMEYRGTGDDIVDRTSA
jgi:ribosomal protein S18 acetylase RimI-like enzyme